MCVSVEQQIVSLSENHRQSAIYIRNAVVHGLRRGYTGPHKLSVLNFTPRRKTFFKVLCEIPSVCKLAIENAMVAQV